MALISQVFPITFKRKPAQLYVIRNNGYCWGRLVVKMGEGLFAESDVITMRDLYDEIDEVAAEALERAAKRGNLEPPAASWRMGWISDL